MSSGGKHEHSGNARLTIDSKPLMFAAALIAVIMAVILAAWYFDAGVTSPDVIGLTLDDAATSLHDAGIRIDIKGAEGNPPPITHSL